LGEQRGIKVFPVFKEDYRRGNVFWFEMVFKPLKKYGARLITRLIFLIV